jgi:uncharacterized membrane protein YbhN (UPF0104 family)
VLRRLTFVASSPRVRLGVLVVVLSCCGYALYKEWPQVAPELGRLRWYTLALSLAAAMAGTSCLMLAWRTILADLGSRLPARQAARVSFVAQLGKYVPGGVWAVAAQVELGHDYRIPRTRSLAAVLVSLSVTIGSGLAVAVVTLPFASPGLARHYWWVLAAVPVIAGCLCPPVLGRLLDLALSLAHRPPFDDRPTWRGLGRALSWNLAGWLLLGGQVWLLVAEIGRPRPSSALLAIGGYALAFSAGSLLVVVPSGLGARELILTLALVPMLSHGAAITIALCTRLISTFSDIALGALSTAAVRSRPVRTDKEAPARETAAVLSAARGSEEA